MPETRVHAVHAFARARLARTFEQREGDEKDNEAGRNQESRSREG